MPNLGYPTWGPNAQSGPRCRYDDARIVHRNPFLSNAGTSPWKDTAARNCWMKSVPVLSLPKGCHAPQTVFLSHRAGLRRLDQTLHLLPRRAPVWRSCRINSMVFRRLGFGFRLVHGSIRMLRRRIDRIQFERLGWRGIDHVVVGASRHDHSAPSTD